MKPTNEFDYEAATMDEKVEYWHTHNTGDTLREFLKMSQDEYDAWMVSGKEPGAPLRKAIAIDFDGCLFHTEHMKIVSPNWDVINRSKGEKETGTGLILWTCRAGALLEEAFRRGGEADLLVLDEALGACAAGLLEEARLLELLAGRPEGLEVVLTGRDPSQALLDAADYVTEMRPIKHPYERGVPARPGIEY